MKSHLCSTWKLGDHAQFYADLNIDGRFLKKPIWKARRRGFTAGIRMISLMRRNSADSQDEREKAKKAVEDLDLDEFEEIDETTLILDEVEGLDLLKPTIWAVKMWRGTTTILNPKRWWWMMKKRKLNSIRFHLQNDLDFHESNYVVCILNSSKTKNIVRYILSRKWKGAFLITLHIFL